MIGKTFGPTLSTPNFFHEGTAGGTAKELRAAGFGSEGKNGAYFMACYDFCRFSRWKWHEHFWQPNWWENNFSTASRVSIFSCLPNVVASFDP